MPIPFDDKRAYEILINGLDDPLRIHYIRLYKLDKDIEVSIVE